MLISVTMALDSLEEQVGALTTAEQNVERQRAIRDNLIRDALGAHVSYKALIRITGLSRDRLYTIANSPRKGVQEL